MKKVLITKSNIRLVDLLDVIQLMDQRMRISVYEVVVEDGSGPVIIEGDLDENRLFTIGEPKNLNWYIQKKYTNSEIVYWTYDEQNYEYKIVILTNTEACEAKTDIIFADMVECYHLPVDESVYVSKNEFILCDEEDIGDPDFTLGFSEKSPRDYLTASITEAKVKKIKLNPYGSIFVTIAVKEE